MINKKEFTEEINTFFEDEASLSNFIFKNGDKVHRNLYQLYQKLRGSKDDYSTKVTSLIRELEKRNLTQKFIDIVREEYPNFYENFGRDINTEQDNLTSIQEGNQQKEKLRILNLLEDNYLKDLPSDKDLIKIEIRKKLNKDNFTESTSTSTSTYEVENLLDENKQILLILGDAYVGKTTTLFQLSKIYWEKAKESPSAPLPIGLDLSRWNDKSKSSFEQWLIPEMLLIYQIQDKSSIELLKKHQIILFLDGLERLKKESRLRCIQAINKFVISFTDNIKIVVSCSTEQYREMSEGLKVERTTCFEVQPLEERQINDYLNRQKDNQRFKLLKQLLQNDQTLRASVRTPLVLKIMTEINNIEQILKENDLEKRRKLFIKVYVDKQFEYVERAYQKLEYKKKQIEDWLSWLSKHMGEQAIFFIEEMQPEENDWLNETQRKTFRRFAIWWHGLLFGFFLGSSYGIILNSYLVHLKFRTNISLEQGLKIGIIQGIITGTIASSFQKRINFKIETYESLTKNLSIREYWKKITENMRSIENLYLVVAVMLSIAILCIVAMPMPSIGYNFKEALFTATTAGPFFGLVILISRSIEASFIKPQDYYKNYENKKPQPNQGIQELFNVALKVIGISALSIYIFYIVIILIFNKIDIIMLLLGLIFAVVTGFVACLIHPSSTYYRLHYTLRVVLVLDNKIPFKYVSFLNYVVQKLSFMKRISGGYQFSNPLYEYYFKNYEKFK